MTRRTPLLLALALAAPAAAFVADKPMDEQRLLALLDAHPEATSLDAVPALLPDELLLNFVLKHGIRRDGARGHLTETKVSQSADPLAPRVIVFDETTGFTLSWNSGDPSQTANQRLDLLSFDPATATFDLGGIDFPITPGHVAPKDDGCESCHGPSRRPIFAMYPDWPAFYGSDNDELTGASDEEKAEMADYTKFRATVAPNHPRYAPLYAPERVRRLLGRDVWPSFPYRPDLSEKARDASRAFAFRPALRLGVLYNRLNAQAVAHRLEAHPNYARLGTWFEFNLLECRWTDAETKAAWLGEVAKALGAAPRIVDGDLVDYRQAWSLFGLTLADVDIRYSWDHSGYARTDARGKPMEVGYIGRYFNSYFDGSATIDELVAARLYRGAVGSPRGLTEKYQHLTTRFQYDEAFFRQMDALGRWLPIPFPAELSEVHHRETYTDEMTAMHAAICGELEGTLEATAKGP